jgi:hypothetical protein
MSRHTSLLNNIPAYALGILVAGILMGGIYSLPAMKFTGSKEPWYTLSLATGLTITVLVIGLFLFKSDLHILLAILAANILLLIRRCFGKLDHNVERFGLVHAVTLTGCFWYFLLIARTT